MKIEMKEESLFEDEVFNKRPEQQNFFKNELDLKLIRKDISLNSQSIKCEEDLCEARS